jgi:hypothetical protein
LLTAAVLLFVGFGIKDSVDLSIKQRQLNLSYAKEMQELVQQMSDKSAEMNQLEATAVVLASYGEAALPPLLNELRYGGLRANGAEAGIRALALMHPAAVCEVLPSVLTSRAWRFSWESQVKAVRILGEGNCSAAIGALKHYRKAVAAAAQGDRTAFETVVRELPRAPADDYPRILDTIDKSLHMLERR